MKKLILVIGLLIGGTAFTGFPTYAAEATYATDNLPEDAKQITVYRVKHVGGNAWSSSPVSAYYSASENCIYVNEGRRKNQPYTVYENRAYGQSQDGRGEFRYQASDYYFNL